MSLPRVAIALGDPAGIGPEISLKTALDPQTGTETRTQTAAETDSAARSQKT